VRVLLVSRYCQSEIKGANVNVYRQARSLKIDHGLDVEILTWPFNDRWSGPVPDKVAGRAIPPTRFISADLTYHVINPPGEWNERVPRPAIWDEAVKFGVRVLEALRPDLVHLHHWFGLWWILESAQRLGIPTVYTNHDWGMACLRTILVMGDGSLCDGSLSIEKCARCICEGRGFLGKVNELIAETVVGRFLIEAAYRSPLRGFLQRHGAVRLPAWERVHLNLVRAKGVLSRLGVMFTPSHFGRAFFARLGVPEDRIRVLPWYHDAGRIEKTVSSSQPFTMTYIGRVSPEKGVHLVFEALKRVRTAEPIHLRVAGADSSPYCMALKRKFACQVGQHTVEWLGWSEPEPLLLSTHVTVIPSLWIDNVPLALIEALSYRVPVIATRVAPIEELILDGENGYLAEYNSIESLAAAIQRAVADKQRICSGTMHFPRIRTCREYTEIVKRTYMTILRKNARRLD
jgi:glycosyltransferase involved in cell wall biosynthesis